MRKTVFLLLACAILASLWGCHKSSNTDQGPRRVLNIPDDFKEWSLFQPGSYWVYKDEKTGIADCTAYKHGPYTWQANYTNVPLDETYIWFYTRGNQVTGYDIKGGLQGNATLLLNMAGFYVSVLALNNNTILNPGHGDTSNSYSTYKFIERWDTLIINKHPFPDVLHTRNTWPGYYVVFDFYWAKGVGLVRLQKTGTDTDTTWSLMRWKSVQ